MTPIVSAIPYTIDSNSKLKSTLVAFDFLLLSSSQAHTIGCFSLPYTSQKAILSSIPHVVAHPDSTQTCELDPHSVLLLLSSFVDSASTASPVHKLQFFLHNTTASKSASPPLSFTTLNPEPTTPFQLSHS